MTDRYRLKKLAFDQVSTYSLKGRRHKVSSEAFADPRRWEEARDFVALLPDILKAADLKAVVEAILAARSNDKPVILGVGAHVIKVGCSPLILDLMERGVITGLTMHGAGLVHDVELALMGATSEDVEAEIGSGRFGMAEETAATVNAALARYVPKGLGVGEAVGRDLVEGKHPYVDLSLLAGGYAQVLPVTVHVALGTDVIHMHPSTDGALVGEGTYRDFQRFCSMVSEMGDGGVYINIGSAVLLPEIFLKALSLVRNLGHDVRDFTTVDFDMIRHYRPSVNVVARPTQESGAGYSITGHHELLLPLLYHMLRSRLEQAP
jgi:hypothetical protein